MSRSGPAKSSSLRRPRSGIARHAPPRQAPARAQARGGWDTSMNHARKGATDKGIFACHLWNRVYRIDKY